MDPLDVEGLILFGSGVGLLSYVLEIFGEHTLSRLEIIGLLAISLALIAGYGFHATRTRIPAAALEPVSHSHLSRVGQRQLLHAPRNRGVPFLLPLLYQVGLGFTPIDPAC